MKKEQFSRGAGFWPKHSYSWGKTTTRASPGSEKPSQKHEKHEKTIEKVKKMSDKTHANKLEKKRHKRLTSENTFPLGFSKNAIAAMKPTWKHDEKTWKHENIIKHMKTWTTHGKKQLSRGSDFDQNTYIPEENHYPGIVGQRKTSPQTWKPWKTFKKQENQWETNSQEAAFQKMHLFQMFLTIT